MAGLVVLQSSGHRILPWDLPAKISLTRKESRIINEDLEDLIIRPESKLLQIEKQINSKGDQFLFLDTASNKIDCIRYAIDTVVNGSRTYRKYTWQDIFLHKHDVLKNSQINFTFKDGIENPNEAIMITQKTRQFLVAMVPILLEYNGFITQEMGEEFAHCNSERSMNSYYISSMFDKCLRNCPDNIFQRKNIKRWIEEKKQSFINQYAKKPSTSNELLLQYVDWSKASHNPEIIQDLNTIEKYKHKLNWHTISRLPLPDEVVERYKNKINWAIVSQAGLKISDQAVNQNIDLIHWKCVSKRRLAELDSSLVTLLTLRGMF